MCAYVSACILVNGRVAADDGKPVLADYAVQNSTCGEGNFSRVRRATHRRTGAVVAVKVPYALAAAHPYHVWRRWGAGDREEGY